MEKVRIKHLVEFTGSFSLHFLTNSGNPAMLKHAKEMLLMLRAAIKPVTSKQ